MSQTTLQRVKSILRPKSFNAGGDEELLPEIGFKVVHHPDKSELAVKVIGARNLPACYGNLKPQGYLVKVTLFPGKEKYETEIVKDSGPCFNQEFKFQFPSKSFDQFAGKFVTFTAYAALQQDRKSKLKARASFKEHIEAFLGNKETVERRRSEIIRKTSDRFTLNNRRTIGAVTYNLEKKNFTLNLRGNGKATPDIWRRIQHITSGVSSPSRESKKGSLEITMSYSNSEDGRNDMIQVSLSKLRCSMQTMQEHEKLGGSLYINMATFEYDVMIAKWKSDVFVPTISMKIDPKTATMQATVNNYNIDNVRILIKLKCKNMLSKKLELGQIEITKSSHIWKQIIESPTIPVTLMIDFV